MTPEDFEDLVRPYRRELAAHCYRMLGSLTDAEDQVQETLLRAWRGIDGFEGRSSMRSWLYKIATNICVDAIRRRPRRMLPIEQGTPHDPQLPLAKEAEDELLWVEPAPLSLVVETTPETQYSARESVQLAFIVALQHLPATQRAAIILRDVLGWSAQETAELLDTSVASVNSALQRAREALSTRRAKPAQKIAKNQAHLARYVRAWETADLDGLAALLHEDVVASMPPMPEWFSGRDSLISFLRPRITTPGYFKVVPIEAADDLVFAFYLRDATSQLKAHGIQIVEDGADGILGVHIFFDVSLFARFQLPEIYSDEFFASRSSA
jgi:RNA polymerase sigma-70 factor (ECF subfamily)